MNKEDAVFAKAAWRLLPFMMLLFVVSFLDRVNVGFAALTMNKDLGFTPEIYGFGAGIFFWGYFLFEVPSNVILARVGARLWICRIMLTWGFVSMATALVTTAAQFYAVRFALGLCEAGFFPGMVLYLTFWFPAATRARFFAMFLMSVPLASVIGGPISGAILSIGDFGGLRDWQWLFLIEGLPSILLAFAVLAFLPDGPPKAAWLNENEKAVIVKRLAAEPKTDHVAFWPMLADARIWLCALVYFGLLVALYGINFWLPQIVKAMGYSNLETGLMVAVPYLASMVAMASLARSSDARGERIWHTAGAALIGAAGLATAAYAGPSIAGFLALAVATAGMYSAVGLFWTLPTSMLSGVAAAGGIALVNSIGNLGGFFGPVILGVLKQMTGDFRTGIAALAAGILTVVFVVLLLGRLLPLKRA